MRVLLVAVLCLPVVLAGCSSGNSPSAPMTHPPVANAGGPYSGLPGAALSFNGGGSTDPQGQTLTYAWNFGDNTTGTGINPTHTYSTAGQYTISLTVADTSNLTSTVSTTATIAAQPPVANAGGPYSGLPGVALSFNGSGSTDPQSQALTYAWNFGDNTTGTGVNPTHTYSVIGKYNVSLSVTDTSGLSATASTTATITVHPPVANAGGPYTGLPGVALSFSGSASSDPQGQTLAYAWNFGDSTTGTGVNPTHTYSASGNYAISLAVTDTSNLTSTASTTVTINAAGSALSGTVQSGNQAISGAHVYLFAANTIGYGQSSISLLTESETGSSDTTGAYILTDSSGGFIVPSGYGCPVGSQLYLYALGGAMGTSTNSASGLLAALGSCTNLSSSGTVRINEVTTIVAAYALAGFATDSTHVSSSGTSLAITDVANAFANAANLASMSTGAALAVTPAGNGVVPQSTINTLANILNACVSSAGPSSTGCSTLFTNAKSGGSSGTVPTDTATAAINVAHNPGANISALFGISTLAEPFAPALGAAPNDFTVGLIFSGGGMFEPWTVAIDASGNAWLASQGSYTVFELSSTGVVLSGTAGFDNGGSAQSNRIAVDRSGNVWMAGDGLVTELSNTGVLLSGSSPEGKATGFTSPNLEDCAAWGIASDALGNAWVAVNGLGCSSVTEFSNSGSVLSGPNGYADNSPQPFEMAIDGSGNAWVLNGQDFNASAVITKISSSGAILSGTNGYVLNGIVFTNGLAIDSSGNAWLLDSTGTSSLLKVSNSGTLLAQYSGGGLGYSYKIVLDGAGSIWVANAPVYAAEGNASISEFASSGVPITGPNGYTAGGLVVYPSDIAIDGSGDVWITPGFSRIDDGPMDNFVIEIIGAATPVVTPIAAGLPAKATSDGSSNLATRP